MRGFTKGRIALAFVVIIIVAAGVVVYARYARRVACDSFNQHLATLAGPDAVCCNVPKSGRGHSPEFEKAMAAAFAAGRPFWGRDERHYMNIHDNSEQWDVSEGFVYAADGEFFQIDRYPPTLFRPARLRKFRWINPHINTRVDGSVYVAFDNWGKPEEYTLDP
jgi:hypothetical protein